MRWRGYGSILVVGVILVPLALVFACNSWGAPDDAAYVRMAFAQVAGSTVAIMTAVGVAVASRIRRTGATTALGILALFVTLTMIGSINTAAATLLQRLG